MRFVVGEKIAVEMLLIRLCFSGVKYDLLGILSGGAILSPVVFCVPDVRGGRGAGVGVA